MGDDTTDKLIEKDKKEIRDDIIKPIKAEVNFMQYPIGNVYAKSKKNTILYKRKFRDGNEEKEMIWRVMGTEAFGLPGPSAIETDLAITKLINDRGWPVSRYLATSLYEIAMTKGVIPKGANIESIRQDLKELVTMNIESQHTFKRNWELDKKKKYVSGGIDAFFHKYEMIVLKNESIPDQIPKSELSEKEKETGISEHVYIVLNEMYTHSFNTYYTRKIDYKYMMDFPDVVLKRLYLILNLAFTTIMNNNNYVKLPYTDFCQRIPLEIQRHISKAKEKLNKHLTTLITFGYIKDFKWVNTKSKNPNDWELHIYPGARANNELEPARPQPQLNFGPSSTEKSGVTETLSHFFSLFELNRTKPTDKEKQQAAELLTRVGSIDKVKRIIYYARIEAMKTRYDVKFFGGILQYEPFALEFMKEEDNKQAFEETHKNISKEENQERLKEDMRFSKMLEKYFNLPESQQRMIKSQAVENASQKGIFYAKSEIGIQTEIVKIMETMVK
ncbi:MAG: hypothetical protein WC955_03855 [Elusimicrobiota bacterium]